MDTKAIEEYSKWARRELIERVGDRLYALGLSEKNRISADATVIGDRVLTDEERAQRDELIERIDAEGEQAFVERTAYTWFNRLAAIRYMEVHDFLPSRTRILSGEDGSANSQALKEISSLDLPALDTRRALDLALQGTKDDELFNMVLLAQCDQLADCMPAVFEHLGAADALTLPVRLYTDKDGVVARLVNDIPESSWNDVEILGWMYQFYISERKDEAFAGFKKGKKASRDDIGPATQLFTPDWIVRYMVENSLGRLWMLNTPTSPLRAQMKYYIEPEGEVEGFIKIDSPEDITFCDPACGSGHILVYAFDLLWQMYEERGYSTPEIATLILTKNLHGIEIDPRAAQYAVLQLMMKAREHDRRFLSRGVVPDVCVLEPVAFEKDERELLGRLVQKTALLDALEHLTECGSLLKPEADDIAAIREALDNLSNNLAGEALKPRLERALASCESLARTFDVVVANPPYMGSSNFNVWTSAWVKKNYPDEKSDLFSAFIKRISYFAAASGEVGMMTPYVWMFISSYEKLRTFLIDQKTITSLVQLEYSGFAGATVPICTFTFHNTHMEGYKGGYVRLSDFVGSAVQGPKTLEAIANHECGWFYRADADSFKGIPGSPIAYWASEAMRRAFDNGISIDTISAYTGSQNKTGDNERYVRFAWEVSVSSIGQGAKWVTYFKGGDFRRWYGNLQYIVDWDKNARLFYSTNKTSNLLNERLWFKEGITYTMLTSGKANFRYAPACGVFDMAGPTICGLGDGIWNILGMLNSSFSQEILSMLNPTLNLQAKDIKALPIKDEMISSQNVCDIVRNNVQSSAEDYDAYETSLRFKRHPMI